MPATEIDFATSGPAYQAIRRKLLSLRRCRKSIMDSEETIAERRSKRRRGFAPPEVIKRLNGEDNTCKVGVKASIHVGENGTAVFLMPLHGKASESLTSLLETFHIAHATKKPVVDGPVTPAFADVTPHADEVAAGRSGPTAVPDSRPLQETDAIAGSYISDSSSATVEGPEHDHDRSDVFGQISLINTHRAKDRLTSVSSDMSVASNTTVILVGSLTPGPRQAGPSVIGTQLGRSPSEITVDWRDAVVDEQEGEDLTDGNASPLSISPGSPKTMHIRTPSQSGMPSPNVEIYSTANTPGDTHLNRVHSTHMPGEGKETTSDIESQDKHVASERDKKQEKPVVPFFYGSKIPVMAGKLSNGVGNKNTYGSLIAHQRQTSNGDLPSTSPRSSTPKPHSCAATPLATPKTRGLKRALTTPVRVLTRKDTIAGHFPSTPPRPTVSTSSTSGGSSRPGSGSPRPRSSSKIPIPSPTTPKAIGDGRKLSDLLGLGVSFLSDIAEANCENEAIWDRRRDDVMGPLGVSPTTRLGGFVRPASMTKSNLKRASTMPMGSLVGAAMASNDVMR